MGQLEAAKRLGISLSRLNEIVLGKRSITADTALRLARFLKTSPQLWMRLQADWDLHEALQREARRAGSRLRASGPTGGLNAELLCVLGVQSLPAAKLHDLGAGHASNGLTGEKPIQHIEADVPPGSTH